MTAPTGGGRVLPPDLAARLDDLIGRGDVEGYLELLRETDDRPAPLPPACDRGCPDAEYWRAEAFEARAAIPPVVLAQQALTTRGLLPAPELLAYEDAPAPMGTGQRLLAAALVGPWLACSTGWAAVVGVAELIRWVRR